MSPDLPDDLLQALRDRARIRGITPADLLADLLLMEADPIVQGQGILEQITDAFFTLDTDWRFVYINPQAETLLRRPIADLLGRSVWEAFPQAVGTAFHDAYQQAMRDQTTVTFEAYYAPMGTWFDVRAFPSPERLAVYFRDVTEERAARQTMEEQNELLQIIVDNIPVMISLFDAQGRFEVVNRTWVEVLGWDVPSMLAHDDIMSAFYPDPAVRAEALDYMIAAVPGWRDFETTTRDGRTVPTSWANVRLSDGRSLGIGVDNTARRELEAQRLYAQTLEIELQKERELSDLKDRFASMVSHDFRTPLAVIQSSVDLIERYRDRMTGHQLRDKLDGIRDQVAMMVAMMDDLLAFSRGRSGKLALHPTRFEAASFVETLVNSARLSDTAGHEFAVTIEDTPPGSTQSLCIYADRLLLEHAVGNLLSNAIKYSLPGTLVQFSVTVTAAGTRIRVQDAGIGIPPQDLPHLFEPFHRAKNTAHIHGSGLGLVIVKLYVDLHGGTVTVDSTLGLGTTITLDLPPDPSAQDTRPFV